MQNLTPAQAEIGLRTAVAILDRWGATVDQSSRILGVSHNAYTLVRENSGEQGISLDSEQLDRISTVLNIHETLRALFDNPRNLYGFPAMPNHNDFFNGRSPLEAMAEGDMHSLRETYRRLDSLRWA